MSEEFVMVPRKMLQAAYDETEDTRYHQEWMREVLSDQHQGEPVGDGVHDDTEAVRARLAANYFESKP